MIAAVVVGVALLLKLFLWKGIAGDLIFAMWLLTAFALHRLQKAKSPFSLFIGLWLVASGLSMTTTRVPVTSLTSWFMLDVFALLFCLLRTQLKTRDTQVMLWGLLCLGALASAIIGIREKLWMLTYVGWITDPTQKLLFEAGRACSLQGWPTLFAGYLILFIPSAILNAKKHPTLERVAYLIILLLGLFASGSVLPVVCLGLALVFLIKIDDLKYGLLALLLILVYTFGTKSIEAFLAARWEYYQAAFSMIAQHPILGAGVGSFHSTGISKSVFAHNSYLQALAETGPLGFFALVGIAAAFFKLKPHGNCYLETGLYAGLTAVFLDNLVSFTILKPSVAIFWWSCLALYNNVWDEERGDVQHSKGEKA